jgi:hypothetical protein
MREPFVHFLLLGALLFALNAWRETTRPQPDDASGIEVTKAVIERLRAGYERQFNHPPDEAELRGLVAAHVREEVLCREALAMGLDRDDTIVRRRLAQKMEFLTDDLVVAVEPDAAALQRFFAQHAARYAQPARVSFRHVYFSHEKRAAGAEASVKEALAALARGASDDTLGDPFLHGFEFVEREPDDLAALFGGAFVNQLAAQREGAWSGPVASSYGLHLVRIEGRSAPRPVKLEDVRMAVMRDFNDERRRTANRETFERLRQRYRISVDEAAILEAASPSVRTAHVTR